MEPFVCEARWFPDPAVGCEKPWWASKGSTTCLATFSVVRYSAGFLMLSSPGRSYLHYVDANIPCSPHIFEGGYQVQIHQPCSYSSIQFI